ncbi:hypothetical protein CC85DRAFT_289571 [Cutaneotrichosporon oleaginosum]|uniref:Uncharacterized protein n=1 Tax=Cutaneotrichosporon oleaginosum TaxID=879819 RepID=A0A0J0XBD9_9TREE|nr:uncharacterized protein CC85DRAFT_289571 [Cutaneotrichosporon oleaginosum]KLT38380.1 hypothetical protein CC85DRAFT_289571 [Cutaneotrichosporon oleaginosum]TXT07810.1 hypothetical protein COLE_04734 [Cutaneotrichosporon oleaginosum]
MTRGPTSVSRELRTANGERRTANAASPCLDLIACFLAILPCRSAAPDGRLSCGSAFPVDASASKLPEHGEQRYTLTPAPHLYMLLPTPSATE